jgi:tetratricopeptide (TPR) repeat protein
VSAGRLRTLAIAALLVAATTRTVVAAGALTEVTRLSAIYDLILDARFDDAVRAAARACPPAPPVACELLDVTALWWRMQLDEDSTALDAQFTKKIDAAVDSATAWTSAEPFRAEAWFYLGAAYGVRVQFRVLRGERLAAARDGKHIKEALEQAIALDPTLADARFGIGLYKYYADMAPTAAKILRFLLLLPGGNREEGLRDMIAARDRGALIDDEADYQLHWIFFWYEQQPQRGLALLERLRSHYPENPLFAQRIAEVQLEYFHDPSASLATWLSLAERAGNGRVAAASLALTRARLGAAVEFDRLYETDRAIELAARVVEARPAAPYGSLARARLLLGGFHDRLGHRPDAVAAYRAALAAVPPRDVDGIVPRARAGLRRAPDRRAAESYRLSLDGWRALEAGHLGEAERALDRALALAPDDAVARYRRGRVHAAHGETDRALAEFDRVITARPAAPPVFLARAYMARATILEAAGDRAGAIDAYRSASRVFGADDRTRTRADEAITRLQAGVRTGLPPR